MKNTKTKKKLLLTLVITAAIICTIFLAFVLYASDYYEADDEKIEAFLPKKTTEVSKNGYTTFGNADSELGFVFYPGGKVEAWAYAPLMRSLAEKGIFCVLFEMPFNLAVFDINAADGISEEYPLISTWYIGGHSLGGSMAASFIGNNTDVFKGLVLLGSYSTADLSDTEIRVLSLYGSEDGVMNREKYEANKENLPEDFFVEAVIEGGSHAYFGMYGEQDGDGEAKISAEEQIVFSAEKISDFLYENER